MRLAATHAAPRPAALPAIPMSPAFSLANDAVALDRNALPTEILEGGQVDVVTTKKNDYDDEPIPALSGTATEMASSYRMRRTGFTAALAGAQALAKENEVVAVVQAAQGDRYLVPLGVWSAYDESELMWDDIGGQPHWTSATDHVTVTPKSKLVEALVFASGAQWINTTGHPVRVPH